MLQLLILTTLMAFPQQQQPKQTQLTPQLTEIKVGNADSVMQHLNSVKLLMITANREKKANLFKDFFSRMKMQPMSENGLFSMDLEYNLVVIQIQKLLSYISEDKELVTWPNETLCKTFLPYWRDKYTYENSEEESKTVLSSLSQIITLSGCPKP